MDAVLATIVAGGRALVQLNIRWIKIYRFLHYFLLILPKPFDFDLGIGTNMSKAACPSGDMDSSNPCRRRG